MTGRFLLALAMAAPAAASSADGVRIAPIDTAESVRFVRLSPDDAVRESLRPEADAQGFDYCLRDPQNGAVLRFDSTTGAYVVCGTDGFFEQGVGTVTTQGGVTTLSHTFGSRAFQGLESVHATVNPTTGAGTATVNARDESHGTYARITISASNVGSGDCSSCAGRTAINEGGINSHPIPTETLGFGPTATDVTVLQQFTLNSDFTGAMTRFVAGVGRQGAGPLSFRYTIYSDRNGSPGDRLYESLDLSFSNFPGLPTIGVVSLDTRVVAGFRIWAGIRWNPSTDPLYLPLGTNADSPLSKVYSCVAGQACSSVTSVSGFDDARSLYLSADYRAEWLQSGGEVPYGFGPTDLLSEKCDGAYYRFDYDGARLVQLYSESGPATAFAPKAYANAFARITPILSGQIAGLDGVAETRYNGLRYSALSFTQGTGLKFCTRPSDATDYVCHDVSGFAGATGHFTRIVGVQAGFEISFGDSVQDRIERWMITRGPSAWQTQPLNPLLGQVGHPEFGFPWFAAASSKLGVVYEFETPTGLVQAQLADGNLYYGPFALGTDVPPQNFDSNLATRMAGDCTRSGLCVFGRYEAVSGKNLADMLDFRGSVADPEIRTWQLGSGSSGLAFGRAVSVRGDGTALYGSYTPSTISHQYRLQLDGIDLTKYTKFTISYDFAAGAGSYPLSLTRAGGEWGLAHRYGIDLLYRWDAGCRPAGRLDGHAAGGTGGNGAPIPCEIPIVHRF